MVAIALGVLAVVVVHDDYGITWDEPAHSIYGDLVRAYFLSGGTDHRGDAFLNLRYYGAVADLVPSLLHPANDLAKYQIRHLVCGVFALATLLATWTFARLGPGRWLPTLAVLALATMPRFVGHAFDNLKDIPFAGAVAGFVAAMTALAAARDGRTWRLLVCGLAAGFLLAVRPGGLPVLLLLFFGCTIAADATIGRRGGPAMSIRFAVILAIGWVLMVLPWPWAHASPILRPAEAVWMASRFPFSPRVLYAGAVMPSIELPRTYYPWMLLITTPPIVLGLALLGLAQTAATLRTDRTSPAAHFQAVTALWFLLPLAAIIVTHPNVYDGIRHVLFVLPPLAVLAAIGATTLAALVPPRARVVATLGTAALLCAPLPDLIRLHPYQTTYFNQLVGGLAGAEGRYETDYWVASYGEAFAWVNARARETPSRPVRVLLAGTGYLLPIAEVYAGPNVHAKVIQQVPPARTLPPGVDYCIATARFGYATSLFPDAPIVHRIGRDGTVFTVIRGRAPS